MNHFWISFEKTAKKRTEIIQKLLTGPEYKAKMMGLATKRDVVRKAREAGRGAVKRVAPKQNFSRSAEELAKKVRHGGRKYVDIMDRK